MRSPFERMNDIYPTKITGFVIRLADESDTALILSFIKRLAEFEGLLDEVTATEEILLDSLFIKHQADVIIGEYQGEPVAFALFFHNFSTFLGKSNLYLEDLFVDESFRDRGLGRSMVACLAKIALERGCGRLDWWCLDWNESSIVFYKRMGARPMSDWTVYRVDGEALINLAKSL
ncbi:MAG TPA: GNAT family N-acetyltransferase [Methanomassiliicoccales archaeon]|nr:GNAT family N-acetyltransferase [Methanomassiliicoccales archaeon]